MIAKEDSVEVIINEDSVEADIRGEAYKIIEIDPNSTVLTLWKSDITLKDLLALSGIILMRSFEKRDGEYFYDDFYFIGNRFPREVYSEPGVRKKGQTGSIDTIGIFIPEKHKQAVLCQFEKRGIFVEESNTMGGRKIRTEAFRRECKKAATRVFRKKMLSRGQKRKAPQEIVEVFEDILMDLFETYLLEKYLYQILLDKKNLIRRIVVGLRIDSKTLPAESHIDTIIGKSRAKCLGIEACLERVTGEDTRCFMRQINFLESEVRKMEERIEEDGYIKEEIRMLIGNELDDILSNRAGR